VSSGVIGVTEEEITLRPAAGAAIVDPATIQAVEIHDREALAGSSQAQAESNQMPVSAEQVDVGSRWAARLREALAEANDSREKPQSPSALYPTPGHVASKRAAATDAKHGSPAPEICAKSANAPTPQLRALLAALQAHGVRLRLAGADVLAEGTDALPAPLQAELQTHTASGQLWACLGGGADEAEPLALLHTLNVAPVLVETRRAARAATRQLIRDRQQHPGPLGLDIETSSLHGEPQWLRFNNDGTLSARQPASEDRSGLSPGCLRQLRR
jgi:hypothetical protein